MKTWAESKSEPVKNIWIGTVVTLSRKAKSSLGLRGSVGKATVLSTVDGVDGGFYLDQKIAGSRYWNVSDLVRAR